MFPDGLCVVGEPQSLFGGLRQESFYQVLEQLRGVLGKADVTLADEVVEFSLGVGVEWEAVMQRKLEMTPNNTPRKRARI